MICRSEYDRAAQKYSWSVVVAAISAYALFLAIVCVILLLLAPHAGAIRQWAQPLGPMARTLFAGILFLAPSPFALAFLVTVVGNARRKSILHCPDCDAFIGSPESAKCIRHGGKCPNCGIELLSQDELDTDVGIKARAETWPYVVAFCGFGVAFLVYAIPQPLPVRCILILTAVMNFVVVGYVVLKRKADSILNDANFVHKRTGSNGSPSR